MARNKLPPLFAKNRFSLPRGKRPPIVIHLPNPENKMIALDEVRKTLTDPETGKVRGYLLNSFPTVWYELEKELAMLVEVKGLNVHSTAFVVTITPYGPRGPDDLKSKMIGNPHDMNEIIGLEEDHEGVKKAMFTLWVQAAFAVACEAEVLSHPSIVTGLRLNPIKQWEQQGETLRYVPLSSLRATVRNPDYQPPEEPSGIRKCEHDVRGHWRHYPSGARVWVRSHKRGDPELGTTTRIIQ